MKKIALAITILAALLITSCTNDAIEIEYTQRYDFTLRVNTEQIYDDFNVKKSIMSQILSNNSSYAIAVVSLAYDQQGNLTDSATTYSRTFTTMQQTLSVSQGQSTIVTLETIVNPANDYQSNSWQLDGIDKLSTLTVKSRRSYSYWYEVVGMNIQNVNAGTSQSLNVTPSPLGSIVTTEFFNLDQTDCDYAALFTHERPKGFRVDPSLSDSDKYIYDEYNQSTTWATRASKSNKGGHLEEKVNFDAYLIESGNIRWCITATKYQNDGSIRFTAYPSSSSYFNFENGKLYYAGLYYSSSTETYTAFIGTYGEYNTWYNQQKNADQGTVQTLYREPYTIWGATVADTKSYMSGYSLRKDIDWDEDWQGYYMNYYGADREEYVEYYFTSNTSGLTDSYVYLNTSIDLATVRAQLVAQGYTFVRYDEDDECYVFRKGNTGVLLYATSSFDIVNYYDISYYSSSVKAGMPRRKR